MDAIDGPLRYNLFRIETYRQLPKPFMMDESAIYARLTEIFHNVFDDDAITVTPALSAKDVDQWNSLTHIRLMLTVEKAFKIKLSTSEMGKLQNVGDLVGLINARI